MTIDTIDELAPSLSPQSGLVSPDGEPVASQFRPVPREDNPRLCWGIQFEPLGNWCLVKEVDSVVQTGRIIVPEAYGQTFRKGIVAATGEGTVFSSGTFIRCTVKVGDVVLFGKSAKMDVTLTEGAFLLLRESEMFGIVGHV